MTYIRYYQDRECGGIRGWNWIETDTGAWVGPKNDWEYHHLPNIQKYCKSFRTVIQAGGNQGMYPRLLSRIFERVYTFEPDPLNFRTLVNNCDQDNIVKIQAALGEAPGTCVINRLTMQNVGMHQITADVNAVVPILRGDDVINRNDIDLIMLDLEGYEARALKGLNRIRHQCRPVIFAERASDEVKTMLTGISEYTHVALSAMDDIFVANPA